MLSTPSKCREITVVRIFKVQPLTLHTASCLSFPRICPVFSSWNKNACRHLFVETQEILLLELSQMLRQKSSGIEPASVSCSRAADCRLSRRRGPRLPLTTSTDRKSTSELQSPVHLVCR